MNLDPQEPLVRQKWEAFAQQIALGMNNSEAYQSVFDCSRANARNNASRLIRKHPEIFARVKHLTKETDITQMRTLDHRKKRDLLANWIEDVELPIKDRIAAMRLDAQLAGDFAPSRTESASVSLQIKADEDSLSPELQRRLAAAAQMNSKGDNGEAPERSIDIVAETPPT